ncbi:MAG: PCP reductase family protein [Nitrospirota bacterium]
MHTAGVDEREVEGGVQTWLVRSECGGCGFCVGFEAPPAEAAALVDRLVWTDDARHVLERMPPYVEPMVRREVEEYARSKGQRVITFALLVQARNGGAVTWDPEAERRLENVPAPVRAMARMELERTAVEKGQSEVTVALMEEVKARYFGLADRKEASADERRAGSGAP